MASREYFLECCEREGPVFVKVFRALPADQLDYRHHPRSRSAAELVWLLVLEEQSGIELAQTGKIEWKESPPKKSLAEMVADYEKAHAELAPLLKKLDDRTWEETSGRLLVDGQVAFETTVGRMFWLALFDAVHHRGQLSVYLRPMGGKVPAIYGPSADDLGG